MNRKKIIVSTVFLAIAFLLTSGVCLIQIINAKTICRGVKIAGIEIGGKTGEEAKKIICEKWDNFAKQKLILDYPNNSELREIIRQNASSTSIAGFGFRVDCLKTANAASQIGREKSLFQKTKEQLAALWGKYDLNIAYHLDDEQFQKQFALIFQNAERPATNATLLFDEETEQFIQQPAAAGTAVNKEQLLADLSKNIQSFSNQPIVLRINFDIPEVNDNETESARQKAEKILFAAPLKMFFGSDIWTIKKTTLAGWLKFEPTVEGNAGNYVLGVFLDKNKIEKYLAKIAWATNQPVVDAQLEIEGNRAIKFSIPQEGYGVQSDETANNLIAHILTEPPIKETELIVGKTSPQNVLAQTNNLGINELIGQGKSNFAGSPANRVHNIKTGAAKLNGLILPPGEEFSFNKSLGKSGEEEGFKAELVIKEGKLTPEYGGGLCQVSTTFFRAAVNTGLKITERRPHAFPITYYNPAGFDATVYDPKPDLRFLNDTANHILIQTIIEGNNLTVNFYGTNDRRQAKITGPTILEKKEDGSLKTILTQEIYQDGLLVRSQNFISDYDSPEKYKKEE